jgi:murein DD-endopeptidase MepM/ murein hydrolase activator NlpD
VLAVGLDRPGGDVAVRRALATGLLDVSVGDKASRGEVIGRLASTGYSTGPHAHVELHVDGQPTDITPFLAAER